MKIYVLTSEAGFSTEGVDVEAGDFVPMVEGWRGFEVATWVDGRGRRGVHCMFENVFVIAWEGLRFCDLEGEALVGGMTVPADHVGGDAVAGG